MANDRSIATLAAETPASRERYVDFLRAASILVVVLGHWMMAVVTIRDGDVEVSNLIVAVPALWIATWLLQVMPVFFFVGGFANLVTLDALARRGGTYADYADSRLRRLLRPVAVLLAVWTPIIVAVQWLRLLELRHLAQVSVVVTQLLWFIGIYLVVVALAPPMLRLHRRFGVGVLVALVAGGAVVDVLRLQFGVPYVGFLNFAFVWLYAHQLGFFYGDGSLRRLSPPVLMAGAIAGLLALWLLTTAGPYPRSMVGLPGESISNMNPPTVCLIALASWQVALAMLARDTVTRWLERPRLWGAVIAVNMVIMTVLLWHLTALLLVTGLSLFLRVPQPEVGSLAWWAWRPVYLTVLVAVTAGLVAALGRFERPAAAAPPTGPRPVLAANARPARRFPLVPAGLVLVIVGVCGIAVGGLVDFVVPHGRRLIVLPVSPVISLASLLAGMALVRWAQGRTLLPR